MRLGIHLITALLMTGIANANVPFWGDKASMPVETDPATLKPGQFVWDAAASPAGPIVVVVSLAEQRADVYRNGIRIGVTTVSTGRPGHETPTGVFTILQKDKDHHSTIYNNAAMPYTERLTWGGVALHAGGLPGHPSSHGCVHLPSTFARDLFDISPMGMTVVVADTGTAPSNVVHPAAIAPVDPDKGAAVELEQLSQEDFLWQPDKSMEGPMSILVSSSDRRVLVFRNGVEIGQAQIRIDNPAEPLGTHVFVLLEVEPKTTESSVSDLRWIAVGVPGHAGEDKKPLDPGQAARVHLPASFRDSIHKALHPGVSMMVTDAPVLESTTGVPLTVVTADPQAPAGK
jgi:L,D-transpeptidase catalytic domain